jgi:hypothetical protein
MTVDTPQEAATPRELPSAQGIRRRPWLLALPVALLISSVLVYQASRAAFTDATTTGSQNWTAGTVVIDDNTGGSTFFSAGNLKPGDHDEHCIVVTYTGTLAATAKLYATVSGGLAQYLDLVVEEGTGSPAADCTGFTPVTTLSGGSETLDSFGTAHHDFGTGVSSWAPGPGNVTPVTKAYRIDYNVQDTNAAQAQTATATFTWEAQNS